MVVQELRLKTMEVSLAIQPTGFKLTVKGDVCAPTTFVSWEGYLLNVCAAAEIQ